MVGRNRRYGNSAGGTITRLRWLVAVYVLLTGSVVARLFFLQVVNFKYYAAEAAGVRHVSLEIPAPRGEIRLASGLPIAVNQERYLVIVDPSLVKEPVVAADRLAEILLEDKKLLAEKLGRLHDRYEVLAHGATLQQKERIEAEKIAGIFFHEEPTRRYPEKELFAHLTGFVGFTDDKASGRYGLEEFFDEELRGTAGTISGERDLQGQLIPTSDPVIGKGEDGTTLILTIDRSVQFFACQALKRYVEKFSATGGTVIIQESATGRIIALCNEPTFDPNQYQKADGSYFINPSISFQYEPGSVFKPFTMAAGLDLGKVTPQSTFEDTGEVRFGKSVIRNSDLKAHGLQTMTQLLEESLNTGAVYVQRLVGKETFARYVRAFGFGEPTGITLPAEEDGDVTSLNKPGEIYAATASFGQGIAVTPLQLVTAYSALANGGQLMQPQLVAEKKLASGVTVPSVPQVVRQVLKPETSQTIIPMLVSVVDKGHGKRAGVKGYYVAGKTGTAQIPLAQGGGYETEAHIGNFVGFLPADHPRFTMMTKIDRPQGVKFAESSAAPLFGEIAKFLVNYYKIPPTR